MTFPPALHRALLPDGPVHAGHGPHEVVGGVGPRRGEADRPREPASLSASIPTLMSKSVNYAPHAAVAVVLQGLEAGPGPHVPGEEGLVRPVLRSDDERGK